MEIEMRFFANVRETVGQKEINRDVEDGATVGMALQEIVEEYPEMDLFAEDGSLREFLSVMKNGRDVTYIDGLDTDLEAGDTVSVFPPVAGG
jgi:molybdopterin synthase sulfur carrier subunit